MKKYVQTLLTVYGSCLGVLSEFSKAQLKDAVMDNLYQKINEAIRIEYT